MRDLGFPGRSTARSAGLRLVHAAAEAKLKRSATVAVALLALALAGCGGDDDTAGSLRWVKPPKLFTPADLPNDRTLTGSIHNDTLKKVDLKSARDVRVLGRDGDSVPAAVVFNDTYLHGLYPPTRPPSKATAQAEQKRLGLRASLQPGKSAPLTVSWRLERGADQPVRIDIQGNSLAIPEE